ncbi:MAG: GNAT family N-acetyltransferase [Cytophagaceae bacterium]|nr:GNAT family N-acetyltransferase [Cytophagaceae bacterium]
MSLSITEFLNPTFEATQFQMDWFGHLLASKTGICWAISLLKNPDLPGACGFNKLNSEHKKAEIGFWFLPAHWKEGVMTEVLPGVIEYAVGSLNLHRIEAIVESRNEASRNLLLKLNFVFEGCLNECEIKNGEYIDLDYFAILHRESKF